MAGGGIQINGLDKLEVRINTALVNAASVKTVVQHNGDQLNSRMKRQTTQAFQRGYTQGDTAGSISTKIDDDGMTARVGPKTEYAPYVEYGTRFMNAEPFVRPAWEIQKEIFKKELEKVVKRK